MVVLGRFEDCPPISGHTQKDNKQYPEVARMILDCHVITYFFYFFDVEISYNYNCLSLILFPETYSVGDSIINYPFWGTPMETHIFPPSVAACR